MGCVYELVLVNKLTDEIVKSVCCFDGKTKLQDFSDICRQVTNEGLWLSDKRYVKLTDENKLSLYVIEDGVRTKYV